MLKFNATESNITHRITESFNENSYNRLRVNHGLGYDCDDEMQCDQGGTLDGAVGSKSRKINKVPYKILDAP